jgi:hypothetical protein
MAARSARSGSRRSRRTPSPPRWVSRSARRQDAAPFTEGLHTLSAADEVTLIDVKRTELSLHGLSIEAIREGKKLVRKLRS